MSDLVAKLLPWAEDAAGVARAVALVYAPAGVVAALISDGVVAAEAYESAKGTVQEVLAGHATAEVVAGLKQMAAAVPASHPVFIPPANTRQGGRSGTLTIPGAPL